MPPPQRSSGPTAPSQEANMEQQGYVIRDGVVVIIKDTTIDDGTII